MYEKLIGSRMVVLHGLAGAAMAVVVVLLLIASWGCQSAGGMGGGVMPMGGATQQQKWAAARATLSASQDIAVVSHQANITSDSAFLQIADVCDQARAELDATASKTNISDIVAKAVAAAKIADIAARAAQIVANAPTLTPENIASIAESGKVSDKAFLAYQSTVTGG